MPTDIPRLVAELAAHPLARRNADPRFDPPAVWLHTDLWVASFLSSDGEVYVVDDGPPVRATARDRVAALVLGARNLDAPQLSALLPPRPADAPACARCAGTGRDPRLPILCLACGGLGWAVVWEPAGLPTHGWRAVPTTDGSRTWLGPTGVTIRLLGGSAPAPAGATLVESEDLPTPAGVLRRRVFVSPLLPDGAGRHYVGVLQRDGDLRIHTEAVGTSAEPGDALSLVQAQQREIVDALTL